MARDCKRLRRRSRWPASWRRTRAPMILPRARTSPSWSALDGRGYDVQCPGSGAHLSAHIPATPASIVQNMPGCRQPDLGALSRRDRAQGRHRMTISIPGLVTQSIMRPTGASSIPTNTAGRRRKPRLRRLLWFRPKGVNSWDDMMSRKEFVWDRPRGIRQLHQRRDLAEVFRARQADPRVPGQRRAAARDRALAEIDGGLRLLQSIPGDGICPRRLGEPSCAPSAAAGHPRKRVCVGTFAKTEEPKQILDMRTDSDERPPFVMSEAGAGGGVASSASFNET